MSIKKKAVRAIAVMFVGYGSSQMIRFAGSLITTRILAPELFGVMAIANMIATIVALFSDLGITLSIVRSERGEELKFVKTVFTFKVLQGLFLGVLTSLAALVLLPLNSHQLLPFDSTFAHPDLPGAVLIVALSSLIGGFRSSQIEVNIRLQKLGGQIILGLVAQIFSLAFIIGTALHNPTIYSLAFANVVNAAVSVTGSYLFFDRKYNGFAWDKAAVSEIFSFGKWITLSTAIAGLTNNIDRILFGAYMTSTQMGVYSLATLMFSAMSKIFNKLNSPLYTAFSEVVRNEPNRISSVYYRVRKMRDLIVCVPTGIVMMNADLIVGVLYDDRYSEAGNFLTMLCLGNFVNCFLLSGHVLMAMGESKFQFQSSISRLLGIIILAPIAHYFFGIPGMVVVMSCRNLLGSWLIFRLFSKEQLLDVRKELLTVVIVISSLVLGWLLRFPFEFAIEQVVPLVIESGASK